MYTFESYWWYEWIMIYEVINEYNELNNGKTCIGLWIEWFAASLHLFFGPWEIPCSLMWRMAHMARCWDSAEGLRGLPQLPAIPELWGGGETLHTCWLRGTLSCRIMALTRSTGFLEELDWIIAGTLESMAGAMWLLDAFGGLEKAFVILLYFVVIIYLYNANLAQ